jgi:micrococcal nuclease
MLKRFHRCLSQKIINIKFHVKHFLNALRAALLLFLFIAACSLPVFAAEITYFYDGDTVKVKDVGLEYKLRLTDIDAPERNQTYGLKSRRALMQFCKNTSVNVYISGTDKYKRSLGKLHCNSLDASEFMVKHGHAWFNRRYSMDYMLALLEDEARKNKIGLWDAEKPIPPWVWRRIEQH